MSATLKLMLACLANMLTCEFSRTTFLCRSLGVCRVVYKPQKRADPKEVRQTWGLFVLGYRMYSAALSSGQKFVEYSVAWENPTTGQQGDNFEENEGTL